MRRESAHFELILMKDLLFDKGIAMKSLILSDLKRIQELGLTASYMVQHEQVKWFKPECAFKFLLLIGETLIIAPIMDHATIYVAHQLWDKQVDPAQVQEMIKKQWERKNYQIRAAGVVAHNGDITSWKSECYGVETPDHMREEISREIARLYQANALCP